ncbi:hypothetical protein [Arenimonas alkanexedens]
MMPREFLELPLRERMLWAALAALVGTAHDGPELGTAVRKFERLEAACHSFEVPPDRLDECARLLDYHYFRAGDCYVSKVTLDLVNSVTFPQTGIWGGQWAKH